MKSRQLKVGIRKIGEVETSKVSEQIMTRNLRRTAAALALSVLVLTGCDNPAEGDNPGDEVEQNYDQNDGIDTDQGDDSRGNDLRDDPNNEEDGTGGPDHGGQ